MYSCSLSLERRRRWFRTEPIDDPVVIESKSLEPHLQKAVDDGFMDVDEDEDEDEVILFKRTNPHSADTRNARQ